MWKLLITENDKKDILDKHYGDTNPELFNYLMSSFEVFSDVGYHNLTDGRGELMSFKGKIKDMFGDEIEEIFRYQYNKKNELKRDIVNFIKEDPDIYDMIKIKGISKLMKLLADTEDKDEVKLYSTELMNQMNINERKINTALNKTVKDFIDFYVK